MLNSRSGKQDLEAHKQRQEPQICGIEWRRLPVVYQILTSNPVKQSKVKTIKALQQTIKPAVDRARRDEESIPLNRRYTTSFRYTTAQSF